MKGLDLAERYFEAYGRPMLTEKFPHLAGHVAAGLCGSGSECLGYDDDVSRDHDFEPGFCLFLPGEDVVSRRDAFLLERAYAALPREFMGLRRGLMAPVGGPRRGVIRTGEFFREKVGAPDGVLTLGQWLTVPEQALKEATNGRIFFDGSGEVTRIRAGLEKYPDDVFRKRLAGSLLLMAQSGQYNYRRCLEHGEKAAAQLAVTVFVKNAMRALFLLSGVYMPYYKWAFRALRELDGMGLTAEVMEYLITTDNEEGNAGEKADVIEGIAADVIGLITERGLTKAVCGDLEKHAYAVNDTIADPTLRSGSILMAVRED